MKSMYRASVNRCSISAKLFRGSQGISTAQHALQFDFHNRKSPVTKGLSKPAIFLFSSSFGQRITLANSQQSVTVTSPLLTAHPAPSALGLQGTVTSHEHPGHQPLIKFPFIDNEPCHHFSQSQKSAMLPPELPMKSNAEFDDCPTGEILTKESKYFVKELMASSYQKLMVRLSHEVGFTLNYSFMNRNSRYGKRANRGKRPCSRQRRRSRRRRFGNHRR